MSIYFLPLKKIFDMRSKYQLFQFRLPNYCKSCADVTQIDVVDVSMLNVDIFLNEYAYSGRPLLIKNAAKNWKAMEKFNFEFFKDLYAGLPNTPVLYNGVDGYGSKDCQFFAWKSEGKHHLNNLQVICH